MTPEIGSLWQWAAITLLGIVLARVESQRREDRAARLKECEDAGKALKDVCDKRDALAIVVASQARQLDRLDTIVGVNGNGIMAQLVAMNGKLDKVLNEQAERRGAAGIHTREP